MSADSEEPKVTALDVQASLVADLTPERRERYDAALAAMRKSDDPLPDGLARCETCGWTYSAALWCAHCSTGPAT